jgi:putative tryptophan/tyrosine transport system substrate-binding protein
MRRRDFIKVVAGSAVTWLPAARAQQPEQMRRIGVLLNLAADDPESAARITAFAQGLEKFGWTVGRNVRIDYRWAAGDTRRFQKYAEELVAFAPNILLAAATPSVQALQQATQTVPIVFVGVTDPVAAGFVNSLARPGGNITGFTPFEFGIGVKWLELLKQIARDLTRVAIIREAAGPGVGQLAAIQAIAPSLGVEIVPIGARDPAEIERAIKTFARTSNGGVIVTSSPLTGVNRDLIIALTAQYRLPTVYPFRYQVAAGGLISYGPDLIDEYRRAAEYVDRILKGEKPGDLPVQAPTKYQLVINLKTAKAIGLTIPAALLTRADEVIE